MFGEDKRLEDLIHLIELAGKWDVVKGLRDGVEKAWLEKDEDYVPGSVAAEVYT